MFQRLPLLLYLARSELQRRYAGSAGGLLWALFPPLALMGVMWFALDIGLGMRAAAEDMGRPISWAWTSTG